MPRREQVGFVVFATWMVCGLFLDGWSHNRHRPETFFTPWHGVLYSGFAGAVVWSVWEARRELGAGQARQPVAGERLTFLGAAIFGLGMGGDFLWHIAFGIERNIDALLSPTHLTLMTGGLLMASAPLRAALATRRANDAPTGLRDMLPVLVSAAMTTAVAAFFLMYLSAFRGDVAISTVSTDGRFGVGELHVIHGIAMVLTTNALFVGAAIVLARAWWLPPGSLTLVFTIVAVLSSGLDGFRHPELVTVTVLGGAVADGLAARGQLRLMAPLASLAMWAAWFGLVAADGVMRWPATLWGGAVFLAVASSVALSALAIPAASA